jgi:Mycoplasma protein of unknown function, DUF285
MNFIFCNALVVNSNLSGWDVSNVKDMSFIFNYATIFQGIGVEMWNTSRVETMVAMFCNASSFNANLSQWDVSKVKNTDSIFWGAVSFKGNGIGSWNTSQIEIMDSMFDTTISFDANLSKWDTSKVVNFDYMLNYASSSSSSHSSSSNMSDTFISDRSFKGTGLDQWDTSRVKSMHLMFARMSVFDAKLSRWNTSNVEDTSWMFFEVTAFRGIGVDRWVIGGISVM